MLTWRPGGAGAWGHRSPSLILQVSPHSRASSGLGSRGAGGRGVARVFLLWGQRSPGTGRVPLLLVHRENTLG